MGWVMFFDGDCGFCSAAVRRVARMDRDERIDFAPLQGRLAAERGLTGHATGSDGTMVLWREEDDRLFLRGDAVLELGRALGGGWKLLAGLGRAVPRPLRDGAYRIVARHRLSLMGRRASSCEMPDESLRRRMRE